MLKTKSDLKQFILAIARFQELYKSYDDKLNNICNEGREISAREVLEISNCKNRIAEDLARYILDKNNTVEILNNVLIGEK